MLCENTKAASTAMERLATGSKINKAKDDVAGSATADRMTSQVRGLNMAVKNVNNAMAMLSVADSDQATLLTCFNECVRLPFKMLVIPTALQTVSIFRMN